MGNHLFEKVVGPHGLLKGKVSLFQLFIISLSLSFSLYITPSNTAIKYFHSSFLLIVLIVKVKQPIEMRTLLLALSPQTRVLVTHGVSFLPHVDEIVVLVNGELSEIGSYQSLQASGGAFSEFLSTYASEGNRKEGGAQGMSRLFSSKLDHGLFG